VSFRAHSSSLRVKITFMPSGDEALRLKAAPWPSGRDDRGVDFNHNWYKDQLLLFEHLVCQHAHLVVLYQLARGLVPFSCAMTQAMLAVAFGAVLFVAAERGIWMATLAERIDLFGGIHNIRRRDIVFIGAMGIRRTVATLAADISLRVHGCELIFPKIYMAYIAPAVIG